MEQHRNVESRKRPNTSSDKSLSDGGYDRELLGDPAFHSTPVPVKRARYLLGELQENNTQQFEFDINALENEFEQKRNANQQNEVIYESDPEPDAYEECSWIQQKNFRKDQFNGYLEKKSKKRVQFADAEITPYITGRQIRHTPLSPTPPTSVDSSISDSFEPPDLSPFLNSNLTRTVPIFNVQTSTPFTPAQRRNSLSSSLWSTTPSSSLRSYSSSPALTNFSFNSSLSNASPSKRSSRPSPLHRGPQAVSENYVEEKPLPLILEVEESFHLNGVTKKRHIPSQPEKTFDISTGAVLPAFCPQAASWNKRLNLLAFQWETGIALWNVRREDLNPVPLTQDVGYEFKISRMAWNHSNTTLAMISCRGDLMLWNSLTGRRSQAKPLPKSGGVSMKMLVWKEFVPEEEDFETLYIMTKQGMIFEFKVQTVRVEAVRCIKTFLKDPECLTHGNKFIACTDAKGMLGLWKVAKSSDEASEDLIYKKDLGEIHSWCPWQPTTLAIASRKNKDIKIFASSERKIVSSTKIESSVTAMAWSKDFQELITAEGCRVVCRNFPKMEKVMSFKVDRPVRCLDVREEEDSCLMTLNDKGLIEMWRCFDREDNGCRYLNAQTQSRRHATKSPWMDDSNLASDLSGCSLR